MAIDSKQIDTDLTLELDEDEITASEFSGALEHFVGLVKEVARSVTTRQKRGEWLIKVYPGSAGIGLYGKPGAFAESEMNAIRENVLRGVAILESGERPHHYSDKAIEHARDLSKLFARHQKPSRIRLWAKNDRSFALQPSIAVTADKILDPVFEDMGSVEGTLEVISGHGKFEVVVYDPIDGRSVKCELPNEQIMNEALQYFMTRVEVVGKVRYRKDGAPVSVRVEKIIPLPTERPDLKLVRGILK